ncbi:phospholipid-transporting P-type ATPase [Paratrimastix pyriformis]|uniref:Phospholipid-transporting P-type ATPase n=1 Tax=Paratrimastix pyriformis TaxID=342808 RepID=A0ABQ8U7R3_9EUKA|nr:phospholipid-transporting P-type ATPase [Paratrimastix pyriformis]
MSPNVLASEIEKAHKRQQRLVFVNDIPRNRPFRYANNVVRTTKYTPLTFIPKNLFEQFRRMSNFYFLLVMIINCLPGMSVVVPITSIFPVIFILGISAIKEGYEDYMRHKMDVFTNTMKVQLLRDGVFKTMMAQDLLPGDLVKVSANEEFPADLVLLAAKTEIGCPSGSGRPDETQASRAEGMCYVQTANLDGSETEGRHRQIPALDHRHSLHGSFFLASHRETSLKVKRCLSATAGFARLTPSQLASIRGRVACQMPNSNLYDVLLARLPSAPHPLALALALAPHPARSASRSLRIPLAPHPARSASRSLRIPLAPHPPRSASPSLRIPLAPHPPRSASPSLRIPLAPHPPRSAFPRPPTRDLAFVVSITTRGSPSLTFARAGVDAQFVGRLLLEPEASLGIPEGDYPLHLAQLLVKIQLNSRGAQSKFSRLERRLNVLVVGIFVFNLLLVVACSFLSIWYNNDAAGGHWYLETSTTQWWEWFWNFLVFFVLLSMLIPMSLFVSVEVVRVFQAVWLQWDVKMFDDSRPDGGMKARTSNLNEELGMVEYIFSDKTGTLTQNKMKFVRCSVLGELFECALGPAPKDSPCSKVGPLLPLSPTVSHLVASASPSAPDGGRQSLLDLVSSSAIGHPGVHHFLNCLTLCHGAVPESRPPSSPEASLAAMAREEAGAAGDGRGPAAEMTTRVMLPPLADPYIALLHQDMPPEPFPLPPLAPLRSYQSSSPDELAFLQVTQQIGYTFTHRSIDQLGMTLGGREYAYPLLATLPFTPNRRRMTIILRCPDGPPFPLPLFPLFPLSLREAGRSGGTRSRRPDRPRAVWCLVGAAGHVRMYTKGADSTLLPRVLIGYPGARAVLEQTQQHLAAFSKQGLRTLVVCMRDLDEAFFAQWKAEWDAAEKDIDHRNQREEQLANQIERDLELLGCTGIEDRLQQDCDKVISDLLEAGIRVWVLTGDKEETAVNVGYASKLLTEEMPLLKFTQRRLVQAVDAGVGIPPTEATRLRSIVIPASAALFGLADGAPLLPSLHFFIRLPCLHASMPPCLHASMPPCCPRNEWLLRSARWRWHGAEVGLLMGPGAVPQDSNRMPSACRAVATRPSTATAGARPASAQHAAGMTPRAAGSIALTLALFPGWLALPPAEEQSEESFTEEQRATLRALLRHAPPRVAGPSSALQPSAIAAAADSLLAPVEPRNHRSHPPPGRRPGEHLPRHPRQMATATPPSAMNEHPDINAGPLSAAIPKYAPSEGPTSGADPQPSQLPTRGAPPAPGTTPIAHPAASSGPQPPFDPLSARQRLSGPPAIVIEGYVLNIIFSEAALMELFLRLSDVCRSVICCRIAPLQKACTHPRRSSMLIVAPRFGPGCDGGWLPLDWSRACLPPATTQALVVRLVKEGRKKVTLAIGDGANDVSMIQEAHVGVGIRGLEGLQAAKASDFSIAQFRFLKRLVLVHGRWNLDRIALLVLYSFYKNITYNLPQFYYGFYNMFSGQLVYDSWITMLYNIIFTFLPIMFLAVWDQDLPAEVLEKHPFLYREKQHGQAFDARTIVYWMINSIFHSVVIFWGTLLLWGQGTVFTNGQTAGLWEFGTLAASVSIVLVNLRVALSTHRWNVWNHIMTWGSIALFYLTMLVYNYMPFLSTSYWLVFVGIARSGTFWWATAALVAVGIVPVAIHLARTWHRSFTSPPVVEGVMPEPKILHRFLPNPPFQLHLLRRTPAISSRSLNVFAILHDFRPAFGNIQCMRQDFIATIHSIVPNHATGSFEASRLL